MPRRTATRLRLGAVLLAALVVLAACRSDQEQARTHRERAEELLAEGEAHGAFLELRRALARDPTSAQINFLLAEVLMADRQPGKALFYYQEARRLDPGRLDAYLAEGRLLARGQPAEARQVLGEALKLQPGSVEGWRLLARVGLFEGDAAAALEAARRAVELAPEDLEVQLLHGQAHAASARAAGSNVKEPDRAALAEALAAIERAAGLAREEDRWRAPRTGPAARGLARARGGGAGRLPRGPRGLRPGGAPRGPRGRGGGRGACGAPARGRRAATPGPPGAGGPCHDLEVVLL
jgi:cytochrome c-type biogenesis protein CcmH/NrfG